MSHEDDIAKSRVYGEAEFKAQPLTERGAQVVGVAEDILQEASRARQRQIAARVLNFLKDCGPSIAMHSSFGMLSCYYKDDRKK